MKKNCRFDDLLLADDYSDRLYENYDLLRSEEPIYWSDAWTSWVLTRYDDSVECLKNVKDFSSVGRTLRFMDQIPEDERHRFKALREHYEDGGLINKDPPDHTRLRKLVLKAFSPRLIEKMRRMITELVNELIDKVQDKGQMEMISDFAFPLPAILIAGILGVPPEDRGMFKDWSRKILLFTGSGRIDLDFAEKAQDSRVAMSNYFRQLMKERINEPQDDLISALSSARENNDLLTETELVTTCGVLLVAGHETTANLITNGFRALFQYPDQLEELKKNASFLPGAIEEILRYDSPLQSIPRLVSKDIEFGGKTFKKGDLVTAMIGAANRDPAHFSNPHDLDIHRKDNAHIAFGQSVHFCLGASLARMEVPIAFEALLRRLPNLRLEGKDPKWRLSMSLRGLESLDIAFD